MIYYVSKQISLVEVTQGLLLLGWRWRCLWKVVSWRCFVDASPLLVWILREKSLSMLDRQRGVPTSCSFLKTSSLQIHIRFPLWWLRFNIKVSSKWGCEGLLLHKIRIDIKSFLSKLECEGCQCTRSKQVWSRDIEVGSLVFLALLVLLLFIFLRTSVLRLWV